MDILTNDGADNIGSIKRISFLECYNVTAPIMENPVNKTIDVTSIQTSTIWKRLEFTSETGMLKMDSSDTDNGTLHKISIECTRAKHESELIPIFEKYDGIQLLLIIETMNGQMIFIGDNDGEKCKGAIIKTKYSTGPAAKTRDNYDIVIPYETYNRPPAVTGFSESLFT